MATRCCCIQALHIFAVFLYISLETSSLDPCLLLSISFGVWPPACDSYAPDIKPQQVTEWQKPYYSPTLRRLLPAITSSARKLLTCALLTPTSKGGSPYFTRAYIVWSLLLSITGLLLLLSRERDSIYQPQLVWAHVSNRPHLFPEREPQYCYWSCACVCGVVCVAERAHGSSFCICRCFWKRVCVCFTEWTI